MDKVIVELKTAHFATEDDGGEIIGAEASITNCYIVLKYEDGRSVHIPKLKVERALKAYRELEEGNDN